METTTVKINKETVEKVRKLVKITKQSIGGFIEIAIEEKLKSKKA